MKNIYLNGSSDSGDDGSNTGDKASDSEYTRYK